METLDIVILMDIVIGVYFLYAGITGKGNLYINNRHPKEIREDAKKLLRHHADSGYHFLCQRNI